MTPDRRSGLLLHLTSLPGPYGMGDFGPAAYRFADQLAQAGQRIWQVLPLVPPGYGHSPYSSPSTFAISPLLISPELLLQDGLLTEADVADVPDFPADQVAWDAVLPYRRGLLETAFERFEALDAAADSPWHERLLAFEAAEGTWLADYALFMALSDAHENQPWTDWAPELRDRHPGALDAARREHAVAIRRHTFYQCVAEAQWKQLHAYAAALNVAVLGDLPIYVAHDSADAWSARHLFKLNAEGHPLVVSGAPPDHFTPVGQKWGNPLYWWHQPPFSDWMPPAELQNVYEHVPMPHAHEEAYRWISSDPVQHAIGEAPLNAHCLDWWTRRMARALHLYDIVRLDHFRGFAAYWEVPAAAPTAQSGYWMPGPGKPLFDALSERLGPLPAVAEDLGIITPDVRAIMTACAYPGMRVLQFGFPENEHHPDHYAPDLVAYSGTHDNDTTAGWLADPAQGAATHTARMWARTLDGQVLPFLERLLASAAGFVVLPVQDVLGLGSHARMNTPGEGAGQWAWRLREDALTEDVLEWLRHATAATRRLA